jgi:hypothetical protein
MSQIDSQLRELLEQAVGDPPRHIAVPAVRRRVAHRRITEAATAAIAVVAVAVAGTVVASHLTAAAGGGDAATSAFQGAPRYYLQVTEVGNPGGTVGGIITRQTSGNGGQPTSTLLDALVIRSTATGTVTGRFRCPEGVGWWVDTTAVAAVTDHSFMVACMEQPAAFKPDVNTTQIALFRVAVGASGRVAAVAPVPNSHLATGGASEVVGLAATPDGGEIALAISPGNGRMDIEVLNTVTGRRALWRGPSLGDYWGLSLTSDGRELVFTGSRCLGVGRCTSPTDIMAVSPAGQGGSLTSARVIAGDVSPQTWAAVSPDGSTLAVLTTGPGNTLTVQRISAATGQSLGTLYSRAEPGPVSVGFFTADPSGRYLIVNGTVAARAVNAWIRDGRLVPLRANTGSVDVYWEAW